MRWHKDNRIDKRNSYIDVTSVITGNLREVLLVRQLAEPPLHETTRMKLRKETTGKVGSGKGWGATKEWCASRARPVGTGIIIAGGAICSRLHGDFDDSAYVKLGVGKEKEGKKRERERERGRAQIAFKTIKASNVRLRFSDIFIYFFPPCKMKM